MQCALDSKGTLENAIKHTQNTALKGLKFQSIEEQNAWLAHWEERWAAPRVHGRKKRQVMQMFEEERPFLKALPAESFRYFQQETRTVDDAGLVQVKGSYYAALPARLYSEVTVRVYEREIEILDDHGTVLRRHKKCARKGEFKLLDEDRIFNPSRETVRLLKKVEKLGPHTARLAHEIFARLGRPGQMAIYALSNLARQYKREQIERACEQVLTLSTPSYQALKRILLRHVAAEEARAAAGQPSLRQSGEHIRAIEEYQAFWEEYSRLPDTDPSTPNSNPEEQ